jgi:predicted metal-dependent enzyme (double-stranded beta helix superfamily)
MPKHALINHYVENLRRIAAESIDESVIFEQLGPLAKQLAADPAWIEDRFYEPDKETGFSAFLLHEEADHSLAILAASWVPGMGVGPHDHGTWAVVVGVEGVERNVRYKRLDDRSNPEHAELAVKDEANAGPSDLVCIKTGGIHAVYNDTDKVTLSLHTYGMHINHTIRSQFDLETNTAKEFKVDVK